MPANLENSAMATGLKKISYSNPKGQCQIMFKLLYNCTHFTCQQGHAKNPSSQASCSVHELRTSRCTTWIQKGQRNQRSNCQHLLDDRKIKRNPEKKNLLLLHSLFQSPTNSGKFFKTWEYQATLPTSCETCMQGKKQQLELDIEK